MEPSSTPNELPDGARTSPEAPLDSPADVRKSFGSRLRKLAKIALMLAFVLVPLFLLVLVAITPTRDGYPATRSEKLKSQQRQLEIDQAERDAQSVVERNS